MAKPEKNGRKADEKFLEEYRAGTIEHKILLFDAKMGDPAWRTPEACLDLIAEIADQTLEEKKYDRFPLFVAALRAKFLDLYEAHRLLFLAWCLRNWTYAGHYHLIKEWLPELARHAGEDIETFTWIVDMLAYHGQLELLEELLRLASPALKDAEQSEDYEDAAILADWAVTCQIFSAWEHGEKLSTENKELVRLVESLSTPHHEFLTPFFDHLRGAASHDWKIEDFAITPRSQAQAEGTSAEQSEEAEEEEVIGAMQWQAALSPHEQNLYWLTIEFLTHLYRDERVALTRAELTRIELFDYLFDRSQNPEVISKSMTHPLCPDVETLEVYFEDKQMHALPRYYEAVALLERIPQWLRFLESRNLIAPQTRSQTIEQLWPLHEEYLDFVKQDFADPLAVTGLENWNF